MSTINSWEIIGVQYPLSSVNSELDGRLKYIAAAVKEHSDPKIQALIKDKMALIQQYTELSSRSIATIENLSKQLVTLETAVDKVQKTPFPSSAVVTQVVKGVICTFKQEVSGAADIQRKFLVALTQKKQSIEGQLKTLKMEVEGIEREINPLNREVQKLRASDPKPGYLEELVRQFKGAEIASIAPEFNEKTCINERFNSFVHDVRRPLVSFIIAGQKVFDKSKLKDLSDESITACVVADLRRCNLTVTDFYRVLEFFHQGGTAQGGIYFSEKMQEKGLNPVGIGPEATIELVIENSQLLKVVSTAFYVLTDVDEAEEKVSMGIVAAEGKKQCTSTYDFVTGMLNLSVTAVPFKQGEIAKINGERFAPKSARA